MFETILNSFGVKKLITVPNKNEMNIRQNEIRKAAPIVYFTTTNMMKNKSLPLGSVPKGGWTDGGYGDFINLPSSSYRISNPGCGI
jgi:hypothetical protein